MGKPHQLTRLRAKAAIAQGFTGRAGAASWLGWQMIMVRSVPCRLREGEWGSTTTHSRTGLGEFLKPGAAAMLTAVDDPALRAWAYLSRVAEPPCAELATLV
ncbi:hypothetical protein MPRS_54920 [Mycobacterium paraseoulense]|nr:hypothetical protein MPRS_54920 [Mycobacterium paraseoulense]